MHRALAIAALAGVLGPRLAEAQPKPRVALLKVDVVGMNADIKARFLGVLTQSLNKAGYEVVEPDPQRLMAAGVPPGCVTGGCLADVGRAAHVQRVVVGGIGAAGNNYDITLTMLETQKGAAVAQSVDHCEVCTLDEGLKTMGRAAETIASKPLPQTTEEPVQPVEPPPPQPPPQPHVDVVAPPPPPPPPAETPWYHRSVTRWSLAGASLALAGAGIAMMALDGQCASSEKPTCKNLYDTNTLGLGLVGGAALVGGTAVYLFWTSAPDGGKVVAFGWGGHF